MRRVWAWQDAISISSVVVEELYVLVVKLVVFPRMRVDWQALDYLFAKAWSPFYEGSHDWSPINRGRLPNLLKIIQL